MIKMGFSLSGQNMSKENDNLPQLEPFKTTVLFCHKKVVYVMSQLKTLIHLNAAHQLRQKLLNRLKLQSSASSDVKVLAGHRGQFSLLFMVRGVRRREGAAVHVPLLPLVVSCKTILRAQGSE